MQFKTLQTTLFISLLVAATALFVWLINDYIFAVFWAVVLAVVFYPFYKWVLRKMRGYSSFASLITIVFIVIVVVAPLYILGSLVAHEAISLYESFSQQDITSQSIMAQVRVVLQPLSQFGPEVNAMEQQVVSLVQSFSSRIGSFALDIGKATAGTVVGVLLTLYILFFALRDGEAIGKRIMQVLPLGDQKERLLFDRFVSIVRAMLKGSFIIALVQGLLGGILFAAVGFQAAALWGFVMGILSLIPATGTAIVWLPAGLFLIATGSVWKGIIVLAVGTFVIGLVDNLLRPILVAKDTAMPDVLVLLSVLGGITLFGVTGIIIGPVITAFFLSMWQLFEHDYEKELKKHG